MPSGVDRLLPLLRGVLVLAKYKVRDIPGILEPRQIGPVGRLRLLEAVEALVGLRHPFPALVLGHAAQPVLACNPVPHRAPRMAKRRVEERAPLPPAKSGR